MSISIHAPRVGSDKNSAYAREAQEKFQSTLPVWGATLHFLPALQAIAFQSTLPVWGATNGVMRKIRAL